MRHRPQSSSRNNRDRLPIKYSSVGSQTRHRASLRGGGLLPVGDRQCHSVHTSVSTDTYWYLLGTYLVPTEVKLLPQASPTLPPCAQQNLSLCEQKYFDAALVGGYAKYICKVHSSSCHVTGLERFLQLLADEKRRGQGRGVLTCKSSSERQELASIAHCPWSFLPSPAHPPAAIRCQSHLCHGRPSCLRCHALVFLSAARDHALDPGRQRYFVYQPVCDHAVRHHSPLTRSRAPVLTTQTAHLTIDFSLPSSAAGRSYRRIGAAESSSLPSTRPSKSLSRVSGCICSPRGMSTCQDI